MISFFINALKRLIFAPFLVMLTISNNKYSGLPIAGLKTMLQVGELFSIENFYFLGLTQIRVLQRLSTRISRILTNYSPAPWTVRRPACPGGLSRGQASIRPGWKLVKFLSSFSILGEFYVIP